MMTPASEAIDGHRSRRSRWHLRHWRVPEKMIVAVLGPTAVASLLAVLSVVESASAVQDYARITELANVDHQVVAVVDALQQERDVTAGYIVDRQASGREQVLTQRRAVDAAVSALRSITANLDLSYNDTVSGRFDAAHAELAGLTATRLAVDTASLTRGSILAGYTDAIRKLLNAATSLSEPRRGDRRVAEATNVLNALARTKEETSQIRGELSAVSATGTFTVGQYQAFLAMQARQQSALTDFRSTATEAQRAKYAQLVRGPEVTKAKTIQDTAVDQVVARRVDLDPAWFALVSVKLGQMRGVEEQLLADTITDLGDLQDRARTATFLYAGSLLIVLLAAGGGSYVVARSMTRPLRRLRTVAGRTSNDLLPAVSALLRRNDAAAAETLTVTPSRITSNDEIGDVARAFDNLTRQLVQLFKDQIQLRQGVTRTWNNLAHRTRSLVETALNVLDRMEKDEADPERLEDLFELDHLVTRLRRQSDSLVVLAGGTGSRSRSPSSAYDIVQAALSEVEEYSRIVRPRTAPQIAVQARAVVSVVHLLAELLDNATRFSRPETKVEVSFRARNAPSDPLVILIVDAGVGMTDDALEQANKRLRAPEALDGFDRMGLLVVSRLAGQFNIAVRLDRSHGGGVTARVTIGAHLLTTIDTRSGDTTQAAAASNSPNGHASIPTAPPSTPDPMVITGEFTVLPPTPSSHQNHPAPARPEAIGTSSAARWRHWRAQHEQPTSNPDS